jgi:hypothetical protein
VVCYLENLQSYIVYLFNNITLCLDGAFIRDALIIYSGRYDSLSPNVVPGSYYPVYRNFYVIHRGVGSYDQGSQPNRNLTKK